MLVFFLLKLYILCHITRTKSGGGGGGGKREGALIREGMLILNFTRYCTCVVSKAQLIGLFSANQREVAFSAIKINNKQKRTTSGYVFF